MLSSIYKDFTGWSKLELGYLVLALLVVGAGSWAASPLEFATALTNVMCVLLVAKGRISNYYWGLVGVILYSIVAYKSQLFGNMWLNIFYAPLQFWGIYEWRKANRTVAQIDVPVRRLSEKQKSIGMILLIVLTGCVAKYLYTTNDPAPIADAFTLVASLLAMYLMIKQYSEQWILWIAVNCVSIYIWVIPALGHPGSWAMVATFTIFLINSLFGAYKWFVTRTNK